MKDLKYEHQSIFPCGEGSNLILRTGRKNQTIIFNTCIIFEKESIRMEKFLLEKKILSEKNFLGKQFLSEKILLEKYLSEKKTCWENNFCKKKIYQLVKNIGKFFLSVSGGCDEHDLI